MKTFFKNLFQKPLVFTSPVIAPSAQSPHHLFTPPVIAKNHPAPTRPHSSKFTKVVDLHGREKPIGKKIGSGGEGHVYQLDSRPEILIKIYKPEILANHERHQRLEKKITSMSENPQLRKHPHLAWPLVPLYRCDNRQWIGYAMNSRPGISLRELCGNPKNFGTITPRWHRQHLVSLCVDLLDIIDSLTTNKTVPVDFNPSNFLVDIKAIRLSFIDCDGFQFHDGITFHLSEALLPEMAAPEVMKRKNYTSTPVSVASLRFSVGMILFYILNLGNSPYRHRNGADPVENLLKGNSALGKGANCQFPVGSSYLIWSHLIYDLKSLFIRCFREGHSKPAARPSNDEWRETLLKYNHCIQRGHVDPSIMPLKSKESNSNY